MYHHIHQEIVCSECGSSRHENVSRYMIGWRRCLGCGHEGEKTDLRTGQPYVSPEERQRNDILWSDRMNAIRALPITF